MSDSSLVMKLSRSAWFPEVLECLTCDFGRNSAEVACTLLVQTRFSEGAALD
jgi:hypothetical protein